MDHQNFCLKSVLCKHNLLFIYLLISLVLPVSARADWSAVGTGTNAWIYSLVLDSSGNIYAGGIFATAGGVSANNIAKWNGSAWSALSSGMSGGSEGGAIHKIMTDSSGNLYAGGSFDTAGGIATNNVAKWNGSSWTALGSGMGMSGGISISIVYGLAFDKSGNLYAGGWFTTADGVAANNIAKWNGSAWSDLAGFRGEVRAIATDSSGNLYAGGWGSAGDSGNNIGKWNGSTWSALGSGMDGDVYSIVFDSAGNLYASGGFHTAGGVTVNGIAKWNGSTWSALGSGINGWGFVLAFDSSDNLYVGGDFTTAGGVSANKIAKWNGSAWSAVGSGMSGTDSFVSSLTFDSSGNLYAGGSFTTAGGLPANNLAKWTPNISVINLPGSLAFGDVIVSKTKQLTLTIQNTGTSTLTVNSIAYPPGFSGSWSGTIAAGGSQNVTVTFSPSAVQAYTGTVTVSSDKTAGTDTIAISGSGIADPCQCTDTNGSTQQGIDLVKANPGGYQLLTQAQSDQAVKNEQLKWDANGDGKIGLEDIIRMLQVIAGLRP